MSDGPESVEEMSMSFQMGGERSQPLPTTTGVLLSPGSVQRTTVWPVDAPRPRGKRVKPWREEVDEKIEDAYERRVQELEIAVREIFESTRTSVGSNPVSPLFNGAFADAIRRIMREELRRDRPWWKSW